MTDNNIDHRVEALDALARASNSDQTMSAERFNLDAAQVHALLDIAAAIRETSKPVSTVVNNAPLSQEAREAIKRENEQALAHLRMLVNRHD